MKNLLLATARVTVIIVPVAFGVATALLSAQNPGNPAFEVASVKPHPPGDASFSIGPAGDRFVATNVPLRRLVQWAYPLPSGRLFLDSRIIGGPRWIGTDRFDVQGKARADARPVSVEQLRLMAQSLLEDRFQLKTHREMRELLVYGLVLLKTGAKMKLADDQTPLQRDGQRRVFNLSGPQPRGTLIPSRSGDGNITLSGSAIPISTLANALEAYVDRPVFDGTDLQGLFDLRLEFAGAVSPGPDPGVPPGSHIGPLPSEPSGRSVLFTEIQEQLGLKLEPGKGPADVLIIDHVEQPTPD
jgi:uncharacterized protein (TIGR03435 family)